MRWIVAIVVGAVMAGTIDQWIYGSAWLALLGTILSIAGGIWVLDWNRLHDTDN